MRGACLGVVVGLTFAAALTSLAAWVSTPPVSQPSADSPFEACEPSAGEPWTQERLLCLYRAGIRHDKLPEARARLERLGAGRAEHPWPSLVLGYATQQQDERRALALYEIAASGFARSRDAEGEVLARHNLRNIYHRLGESGAAARQVARALEAAEASKQPLTISRAAVLEANDVIETGGDIGRAYRTLQRAKHFAFPRGPLGLRRTILLNLANASLYLGHLDEAIDALEQHRALRQEDGSTIDAATVAFNLLNARLTQSEQHPRPGARERLAMEASDVLAEVQRLERPSLVAVTHRVLADLMRMTDPDAAAGHLNRCLELERSLGYPEVRARCLWTQALLDVVRDPPRAERASRAAVDALAANPNGPLLVDAWQARLRLVWQTMKEDDAIPASLQALDAIERLRARQQDDASRAALFSNWTRDYYWLTGRLLEAKTARLPQAFEVGERLRARVLLEHLARAGLPATVNREEPDRQAARQRLQQRIVDTQRQLLAPALSGAGRHTLLDQLQLLEIEDRELSAGNSLAIPQPTPFASLEAVQQALGDTEALLWYSVAPWEDVYGDFGGGAWLVSVTRDAVRVHRLPASIDLDSRVAALVGLLRDRDMPVDRWEPAAARLGSTLLGPAIAELPSDIERLVIVSDGELHRLPFEALRPAAGRPRLGEQFEVTLVPSATLWLHLRGLPAASASRAVLVFADPELSRGSPEGDVHLAPLPWARREARTIARTLQMDPGQIREGGAASERFLKETPLGRFAVLHLAAHARADAAFPDRSAVFLAPGDAAEDGWLQPKEIAALELRGQLVVLSACESASGFLLSGEGPLSLARAFFAGGAGGVVATRWPLRDDDAAFVMERFYHALGSGVGAATALRRARRDAIDSGRPAAVWAGLALLGDGRRAPIGPSAHPASAWSYETILATVIVLGALALVIGLVARRMRIARL